MMHYEVIVGNVGCVHRGNNKSNARKEFNSYVGISKRGTVGRIAGESVDLYENGELIKEYQGKLSRKDD